MESFEDTLNGPNPPERIHAAEVDLFGETKTIPPPGSRFYGTVRFDWQRPHGTKLIYGRWTDEDGEWFYSVEELLRRAGMSA